MCYGHVSMFVLRHNLLLLLALKTCFTFFRVPVIQSQLEFHRVNSSEKQPQWVSTFSDRSSGFFPVSSDFLALPLDAD